MGARTAGTGVANGLSQIAECLAGAIDDISIKTIYWEFVIKTTGRGN